MGVAENIKRRRLELGLSQQELANLLNYKTRATISKIESGENQVSESKYPLFARALDTSVEYIKTGSAYMPPAVPKEQLKRTVAIILAGGRSTRNQQNIPNQFINVQGKPVIIYVLETYQKHPAVDDIYVVCLKEWNSILRAYAKQYSIDKLRSVIPAGETGILSVKNGLDALTCREDDTVILQESTRPMVTEEMISKLLLTEKNSAVICEPMESTVAFLKEGESVRYIDRNCLFGLQSPEAFRYGTIKDIFAKAAEQGHTLIEACCSMLLYNLGYELNFVEGNHNNIKIVRQEDIAIFNALIKQKD